MKRLINEVGCKLSCYIMQYKKLYKSKSNYNIFDASWKIAGISSYIKTFYITNYVEKFFETQACEFN